MYYGRRQLILTAGAAILAGGLLHFLYAWLPNGATALLSPVNESLWEHGKLLFWPYLAAALWLNRGRPGGIRPWLLTLLGMVGAMLALGYVYHVLLRGDSLWLDLALYAGLMALGFVLPARSSGPFRGRGWLMVIALTWVLAGLLFWFTLHPPQGALFTDLSAPPAQELQGE